MKSIEEDKTQKLNRIFTGTIQALQRASNAKHRIDRTFRSIGVTLAFLEALQDTLDFSEEQANQFACIRELFEQCTE